MRTQRQSVDSGAKQVWILPPIAGLVLCGKHALGALLTSPTRVDIVVGIHEARSLSILATIVICALPAPDLAFGRRQPVAGRGGENILNRGA